MTNERAIEILERKTSIPDEGETFEEIEEAFDMAISALSADIHGHWKVGFGNTWCSCSECSGNGSTNWSYCPWCGADMRSENSTGSEAR